MLYLSNTLGLVIITITVYLNGIRGNQHEKHENINSAPPEVMNLLDSSSRCNRKKSGLLRHQTNISDVSHYYGVAAWQVANKKIIRNCCNLNNNNNDNNGQNSRGVLHAISIRFRHCRNFFRRFRNRKTVEHRTQKTGCNHKEGDFIKTRWADPANSHSLASDNHQNVHIVDLDNNERKHYRGRTLKLRRRANRWLDKQTSSDENELERPVRSNLRAKMQSSEPRRPMPSYVNYSTTELDSSSEWSIRDVTFDINDLCFSSTSQSTDNDNFNYSITPGNDHRLQSNTTSLILHTQNPSENKSGNLDVNFCPISESIRERKSVSELPAYDRNITSQAAELLSHQSDTKKQKKHNSRSKPNPPATAPETCCIPDDAGDEIPCTEKVTLLKPLPVGIATVRSLDINPKTQSTLFKTQSSLTAIKVQRGRRNERNPILKEVAVTTVKKPPAPISIVKTLERSERHNIKDTTHSQSASQNVHISRKVSNKSTVYVKADNNGNDLEQTECRVHNARECLRSYQLGSLAHKSGCIDLCVNNQSKSSLVRKRVNERMQRLNDWVAYNDTMCSSLSTRRQTSIDTTTTTSLLNQEVDELGRVRQFLEIKPDFVINESENIHCDHSATTVNKSDVGLYIPNTYRKYPEYNHNHKRIEYIHNEVSTNPFDIDHHDSFFESEEYGDFLECLLLDNKIEMDNVKKMVKARKAS